MEQQSTNWLSWRHRGLGSSDAPIIMGLSPWRTPYQLWEEKRAPEPKEQSSNWAQQRGIDLEPKARAYYETLADCDMPAYCLEHPKYPFLRASLDGYNPKAKRILEIKCPGEKDHAEALAGRVPEKYLYQLAHQLLVTDADQVDYVSFDGERGVVVPFRRDQAIEEKLLAEEIAFWTMVQTGVAPKLDPRDFQLLTDPESVKLFKAYREEHQRAKEIESSLESLKKQIAQQVGQRRVRCAGVQVTQITRKGTVDYAKVPELQGVDLERYRKKASTYTEVRVEGGED